MDVAVLYVEAKIAPIDAIQLFLLLTLHVILTCHFMAPHYPHPLPL